ncbi:hypothetical protein U1Q18_005455, partial [Sarracenia purpurea var. burkii]
MAKFTTLFTVTLLLSSLLTYAVARPEPSLVKTQHGDVEVDHELEESCKGVDEEECLMRRTL